VVWEPAWGTELQHLPIPRRVVKASCPFSKRPPRLLKQPGERRAAPPDARETGNKSYRKVRPLLRALGATLEEKTLWWGPRGWIPLELHSRCRATIPLPVSAVVPRELSEGEKGRLATAWEAAGFYLGSGFSTDVVWAMSVRQPDQHHHSEIKGFNNLLARWNWKRQSSGCTALNKCAGAFPRSSRDPSKPSWQQNKSPARGGQALFCTDPGTNASSSFVGNFSLTCF